MKTKIEIDLNKKIVPSSGAAIRMKKPLKDRLKNSLKTAYKYGNVGYIKEIAGSLEVAKYLDRELYRAVRDGKKDEIKSLVQILSLEPKELSKLVQHAISTPLDNSYLIGMTQDEFIPYHSTIENRIDSIEALKEAGAGLNNVYCDVGSVSALDYAAITGASEEMIKYLINERLNLDNALATVLEYASQYGSQLVAGSEDRQKKYIGRDFQTKDITLSEDQCKLLIQTKDFVQVTRQDGEVYYARNNGHGYIELFLDYRYDMIKTLIELGAKLEPESV